MNDAPLPLVAQHDHALPLSCIRPAHLEAFLAAQPEAAAQFVRSQGFAAEAQQLVLLPGPDGLAGAVLGLGDDRSPYAFGDLARRLPEGTAWVPQPGDYGHDAAVLGFCLGAYAFERHKPAKRRPAVLVAGDRVAERTARAIAATRDLINLPPNELGPAELADACLDLVARHGAAGFRHDGAALEENFPAVAAVGRGSVRPPVVAGFHWQGSGAGPDAPLVSLCGKGVVFDTGGYDLKPSAAMLRMKKDMGGAAIMLGLARIIMESDLALRLAVRIGCVENSVSGAAMRPSDIIRTRKGLSVEIGNTDAEGRLVLADLLTQACEEQPALLIDCATLTGAARVALGPDLPALFSSHDDTADRIVTAGVRVHDPVWRLPLFTPYASWLDSPIADLGNVSSKPMAGAITAALFLQRFVAAGVRWAHLDVYAWNDSGRPGRPEGGEATGLRALASVIADDAFVTSALRNTPVT